MRLASLLRLFPVVLRVAIRKDRDGLPGRTADRMSGSVRSGCRGFAFLLKRGRGSHTRPSGVTPGLNVVHTRVAAYVDPAKAPALTGTNPGAASRHQDPATGP